MYVIAFDRCNLSIHDPHYNLALANDLGKVICLKDDISRNLLKQIINLPAIDEVAVWSQDELELLKNITTREIYVIKNLIFRKYKYRGIKEDQLTMQYCLTCQRLRFSSHQDFTVPEFKILNNSNEEPDLALSTLNFKAIILSKLAKTLKEPMR